MYCIIKVMFLPTFFHAKNRLKQEVRDLVMGGRWEDLSSSSETGEEAAVSSGPRPEVGVLEALMVPLLYLLLPLVLSEWSLICSNQPQGSLTSTQIYSGHRPLIPGEGGITFLLRVCIGLRVILRPHITKECNYCRYY